MTQLTIPFRSPVRTMVSATFQLCTLTLHNFVKTGCILWATALTYTTVFALIPLLAVTFSLFQAFGGLEELEERIRPLILKALVPGAQEKLISTINNLIARLNAGAIGAVGTLMVFLAAIFLLGQMEMILNEIWGLKKHRPFFYRLALYWTSLTFGPPLLALSIGIPATLSSSRAVMWLEHYVNLDFFSFLPYLLIWLAFTSIYMFMPNTKVRFLAAAVGGIVGGTIWQIAGLAFTYYTSQILIYSKLYGSLGVIPLFFLWLFISWSIFLIGAELTFTFQNFSLLRRGLKIHSPSPKEREFLSFRVVLLIGKNFLTRKSALTPKDISEQLDLPLHLVKELIDTLLNGHILIELDGYAGQAYLPARNLDTIRMSDVIHAVQGKHTLASESVEDTLIMELLAASEHRVEQGPDNKNVREMLYTLEQGEHACSPQKKA